MTLPYHAWLQRLLDHGEIVFDSPPVLPTNPREEISILEKAHTAVSLNLAGSPIPFAAEVACAAGRAVVEASWCFLNPGGDHNITSNLKSFRKRKPLSPGDHLSADLTLRFLITVYRRALLRDPEDSLAVDLRELFRTWPLTGVLADLAEPPHGDLNFGEHPGLQFLYAERLVRTGRPSWMPEAGTIRERVELVFQQLGRVPPAALVLENSLEQPD